MDDVVGILREQLPRYFRPIIEFQGILKAHGYGIGQAGEAMDRLRDNFYIGTCDEPTIAYYEGLLGIVRRVDDDLGYRRLRVLQKLNMVVPFTIGLLRERLTELYGADGYTLAVAPAACTIRIKVTSDRYGAIDLLYDLLLDILPAHLALTADQEATTYVPGRAYAAGSICRTSVQTIHRHTVTDIPGEMDVAGGMAGTKIQAI